MAYEIIRPNFQLPVAVGGGINLVPRTVVTLGGTNVLQALAAGSTNVRPFGMIGEATAFASGQPNDAVQGNSAQVIEEGNIVKAIAAASFGAGQEVAIATYGIATWAQGGSYVATVAQMGVAARASGVAGWSVGIALDSPVQAGGLFTLYFKPRQLGALS